MHPQARPGPGCISHDRDLRGRVIVVDQFSGFDPVAETVNRIHPNDGVREIGSSLVYFSEEGTVTSYPSPLLSHSSLTIEPARKV